MKAIEMSINKLVEAIARHPSVRAIGLSQARAILTFLFTVPKSLTRGNGWMR